MIDYTSLVGKRKTNEDMHVIFQNINGEDKTRVAANIYAVYDGHGGRFVSRFLHDFFVPMLTDIRVTLPITKLFAKQCIQYLQDVLKKNHYNKAVECGSTCLVVIHYKRSSVEFLNIINVGDSRCTLCRNIMAVPLTLDHKPNYPLERSRIKKLGGEVIYDSAGDFRCQGLSLSRAVGDLSAFPYVICEPDLYKYALTCEDKFIVLGCDGLYEAIPDSQDVVNFVLNNCYNIETGERTSNKIAKKLAEYAIERGSMDNVTVIVVFLK